MHDVDDLLANPRSAKNLAKASGAVDPMTHNLDDLDRLLQTWAATNEPSAERLDRLRHRIAQSSSIGVGLHHSSGRERGLSWLAISGFTTALLALSALIVAWPFSREPAALPVAPSSSAGHATLLPAAHLQSLFSEIEQLFGKRLTWIAETNQEVSLGIESASLPSSSDERVAVRVVVLKRETSTAPWRTVWKGDVASRSEEMVSVITEADGTNLGLWTHVLPDGAVSVDMELTGPVLGGQTWRTNSVQQPQAPSAVLSTRQGDAEIQVWQTATVLRGNTL